MKSQMELFFPIKDPVLLSITEMIDEAFQVARCSILLFYTTALTDFFDDIMYGQFYSSWI